MRFLSGALVVVSALLAWPVLGHAAPDTFADLRRDAYEMAVQMRLDAAEAAFPPSEGPGHRPDQAQ